MAHTVTVGTFEGPFDLLLKLIAQRRMDIHEIVLADITDDYLAALRSMERVDLEATTEFLLIAATLVELKAARLLPVDADPEVDELGMHVRDLLYARLIDYQVFSEAGAFLGGRLTDQRGFHPRAVTLEARFVGLAPPATVPLGPEELAALYRDVVARADARDAPVDTSHLPPIPVTVEQASATILAGLRRRGGRTTFADLTRDAGSRVEVAVTFLAVLNLYKDEHVEVEQAVTCGDLVVELSTDEMIAPAVADMAALLVAHSS